MSAKIDLTGVVFDHLTVLGPDGRARSGHRLWSCKCICGNVKSVSATNLRTRHSTSCGCMKRNRLRDYIREHGPQNVKHANPMTKMHNAVIRSYKLGARNRGLMWGLSDQRCIALFARNCTYCGRPPGNVKTRASSGSTASPYSYSGIDRIDSGVGYVNGNVCACCSICNRAKSAMTHEEFFSWIDQLVTYQRAYVLEAEDGTALSAEAACAGGSCAIV